MIGAVIQARLGSSRLPGKVLKELPLGSGKSIIQHIINSLRKVKRIDLIVIATSKGKENNTIEELFRDSDIVVFRGDENDVLSRFALVSEKHNLTNVIRFTGDNPIIDVDILNCLIEHHVNNQFDHTSTKGLPLGTNINMFTANALMQAHNNATSEYDKEHVEPYMLKSNDIKKGFLNVEKYKEIKDLRLTVDYPSDFALLNLIMSSIKDNTCYSLSDILKLYRNNRWISKINESNFQKSELVSYNEEKQAAIEVLDNLEFSNARNMLTNL